MSIGSSLAHTLLMAFLQLIAFVALRETCAPRPWNEWSFRRKRHAVTWAVMMLVIAPLISVWWLDSHAYQKVVVFSLGLHCMLFATVPCSSPAFNTNPWLRALRNGGLLLIGVWCMLNALFG